MACNSVHFRLQQKIWRFPLEVLNPLPNSRQIRRYVYQDVVRVDDLGKLIDCEFVQVIPPSWVGALWFVRVLLGLFCLAEMN